LADFKYTNGNAKPLDLSDKPVAFLVCNRTNLILGHIILRSGTTGQENRNHVTMYVYIDIQDVVWGTEQTKEELMSDALRDVMFDKLTDIIDDKFPPEQFKEINVLWGLVKVPIDSGITTSISTGHIALVSITTLGAIIGFYFTPGGKK